MSVCLKIALKNCQSHAQHLKLSFCSQVANAVSAKGKFKQIPGCFNFLRKKFFFMCK